MQEELEVGPDEVAERDELPGATAEGPRAAGPILHSPRPDALDVQRRGDLGVPVVEEVPHDERRRILGDRQPVPFERTFGEHEVDLAVRPKVELVQQHVGR